MSDETKHISGPQGNQDRHEPVAVYAESHGAWTVHVFEVTGGFAALATNPRRTVRLSTGRAPAANPHAALEQGRAEVDHFERRLAELAADEPTRPGGRHFLRRRAAEHVVPAELLERGRRS